MLIVEAQSLGRSGLKRQLPAQGRLGRPHKLCYCVLDSMHKYGDPTKTKVPVVMFESCSEATHIL